jgi:hypothetical protein
MLVCFRARGRLLELILLYLIGAIKGDEARPVKPLPLKT